MHALVLFCVNQYTKFEVQVTIIWLKQNLRKGSRYSDHACFKGGLSL